jgi:DNA end-binding protein Ku
VEDYNLPAGDAADYRVSARELQMAEQLIASMESEWTPGDYKDEFRARLQDVIEQRVKAKGGKVPKMEEADIPEDATTNVVDFMSLLQQSIDAKKRSPPSKKAPAKAAVKAAAKSGAKAPAKAAKSGMTLCATKGTGQAEWQCLWSV